jgi:5-methyltetrahydropteroyltriglutamate--homocysteine methyltransferase
VVTDGEQRRLNFQDSFGASVEGYDATRSTLKAYEGRVEGSSPLQRWDIPKIQQAGTAVSHRRPARERIRLVHNIPLEIPLEEYRFVSGVAKKPVKVSLIGPDRISQRFDYQASTAVYRDMDDFLADVVAIEVVISLWYLNDLAYWVHWDSKGGMFPQILLDFR